MLLHVFITTVKNQTLKAQDDGNVLFSTPCVHSVCTASLGQYTPAKQQQASFATSPLMPHAPNLHDWSAMPYRNTHDLMYRLLPNKQADMYRP